MPTRTQLNIENNQRNCCESTVYPFVLLKKEAKCPKDAVPFFQANNVVITGTLDLLDNNAFNSRLGVRIFTNRSDVLSIGQPGDVVENKDPDNPFVTIGFFIPFGLVNTESLDQIPLNLLKNGDRVLVNVPVSPNDDIVTVPDTVNSGIYVVRLEENTGSPGDFDMYLERYVYTDGPLNYYFYKDPYYIMPVREGKIHGGKIFSVDKISGTERIAQTLITYSELDESAGPIVHLDVTNVNTLEDRVIPPAFLRCKIINTDTNQTSGTYKKILWTPESTQKRPFELFSIELDDQSEPVELQIISQFFGSKVGSSINTGTDELPFNSFQVVNPPLFSTNGTNEDNAAFDENSSNLSVVGSCTFMRGSRLRIPKGGKVLFVRRGMGQYVILGFKTPEISSQSPPVNLTSIDMYAILN